MDIDTWRRTKCDIFGQLMTELYQAKKSHPGDNVIQLIKKAINLSYQTNFSEVWTSDEQILEAVRKMNKLNE